MPITPSRPNLRSASSSDASASSVPPPVGPGLVAEVEALRSQVAAQAEMAALRAEMAAVREAAAADRATLKASMEGDFAAAQAAYALHTLDSDGEGKISFDAFRKWWEVREEREGPGKVRRQRKVAVFGRRRILRVLWSVV